MKYAASKKAAEGDHKSAMKTKGVPAVDGRQDGMRFANHEFGHEHEGEHFHDHHRGKKD